MELVFGFINFCFVLVVGVFFEFDENVWLQFGDDVCVFEGGVMQVDVDIVIFFVYLWGSDSCVLVGQYGVIDLVFCVFGVVNVVLVFEFCNDFYWQVGVCIELGGCIFGVGVNMYVDVVGFEVGKVWQWQVGF